MKAKPEEPGMEIQHSSPGSTHLSLSAEWMKQKNAKQASNCQVGQRGHKGCQRESEPVNSQMYFFSYYFWMEADSKQEEIWKVNKNHYFPQITLTLPGQ